MTTKKLTPEQLQTKASELARAVSRVDTDQRGELLRLVALDLNKRFQYHTAKCIMLAAVHYK